MAVGLAHGPGKVLAVYATPVIRSVVDRGNGIDHSGLDELPATLLQLLRRPDARPPSVPPPQGRRVDHEDPAGKRVPARANEMRDCLKHEPRVGAGDQDG
jgi:hypothetical protein